MFSIGEFARHGRVSVRMLRHYDAVGLLRPARVDQWTGIRSYEAAQLSELNRIVALKELGFTLAQVQSILDDKVGLDGLRGMLRLRQAQLQSQITADAARLKQVEARLQLIENEGTMPTDDVQVKQLPGVRVAEFNAIAASFEPRSIAPVIQPLYRELCDQLDQANVAPVGPGIAYYDDAPDGDGVIVHAALPVNAEPSDRFGFAIVDLPAVDQAATVVHRGSLDDVLTTIQTLARWIDGSGYRSTGYTRELYIEVGACEDGWVTELQEPIAIAEKT